MTLTKLKKTTVLIFTDEEFDKVCKAVQAVTNLDNLVDYIGPDNANLLYSMEENVIAQFAGSAIK